MTGLALILLAALAFGISLYLTAVHYAGAPLACGVSETIDCAAVLTSEYSTIPGTAIPITVAGMTWAIGSGVLALLPFVAGRSQRGQATVPIWLVGAHAVWALAAMVVVLVLIWVEVAQVHRLCLWCTAVHAAVFGSLLAALRRLQTAAAATVDPGWS